MPKKYWIPKKLKKGSLSRQLGIPISSNIPFPLLELIMSSPIGTTIHNYGIGKPRIKVTQLLKQRTNFALNVKNIQR